MRENLTRGIAGRDGRMRSRILFPKALLVSFLAMVLLQGCASVDPSTLETARAKYNLGIVYLEARAVEQAQKELLDAAALTPNDPEIAVGLGRVYSLQHRLPLALQEYQKALSLNPHMGEAHYYLGNLYIEEHRWDDAIKEFQATLNSPRFSASQYAYNNMWLAYLEKGQYDKAVEGFLLALRLDTEFYEAHNNLGKAYYMMGKNEEAIREFRDAIRILPGYSQAQLNLGMALVKKGDREGATKSFRRVLELSPDTELA